MPATLTNKQTLGMCLHLQKVCVQFLFEIVPRFPLRDRRRTFKRLSSPIKGSPLLQNMQTPTSWASPLDTHLSTNSPTACGGESVCGNT